MSVGLNMGMNIAAFARQGSAQTAAQKGEAAIKQGGGNMFVADKMQARKNSLKEKRNRFNKMSALAIPKKSVQKVGKKGKA